MKSRARRKLAAMHDFLAQLPDLINMIFNALDLFVVRSALLILTVVGTLSLVRRQNRREKS